MGEDIDGLALLLVGMRANDPEAVLADLAAGLNILVADLGGASGGGGDPIFPFQIVDGFLHLVERPAEIDGRGTCRGKHCASPLQPLVGRVGAKRKRHTISRRRADERRTADLHGLDGLGRVLEVAQAPNLEGEGQLGLIDDLDRPVVVAEPDGAIALAVDVHGEDLVLAGSTSGTSLVIPANARIQHKNDWRATKNAAIAFFTGYRLSPV